MALQRISLLTMEGWSTNPVKRFSPLPAAVTFANAADVLELTPAGSTFNAVVTLNGRLPTVAELAGAPFYHMHVRVSATAGPTNPQDTITIDIDGERLALNIPPTIPLLAGTTIIPDNTTTLLIPKGTATVTLTADVGSLNTPYTLDYSFSVPVAPTNRLLAEPISEEDLELWHLSPLATVAAVDILLVAAAAATPLVLPTEAQLDGAPFFYLAARVFRTANPPTTDAIAALFGNGSTVPSEWLTAAIGAPAEQVLMLPFPERISPQYSAFITIDPMYQKLSPDGQTALSVSVPAATDNLTFQYAFLIPRLQDQ